MTGPLEKKQDRSKEMRIWGLLSFNTECMASAWQFCMLQQNHVLLRVKPQWTALTWDAGEVYDNKTDDPIQTVRQAVSLSAKIKSLVSVAPGRDNLPQKHILRFDTTLVNNFG